MSSLSDIFHNQNQIINVTKECTFEWFQEPKSCYAYLQVSSASGNFTEGETVTGQNSGATATVFSSYVDGGRVYVTNVSGTFQADETITGSSSNQTATVDGFVAERNYPDNIIRGSFPSSLVSKDIDDYLEWESTLAGAGYTGKIRIDVYKSGIYGVLFVGGVGLRVDSILTSRQVKFFIAPAYPSYEIFGSAQGISSDFNRFLGLGKPLTFAPVMMSGSDGQSKQYLHLYFYQINKGTFRWRIHNIRVLKLVI